MDNLPVGALVPAAGPGCWRPFLCSRERSSLGQSKHCAGATAEGFGSKPRSASHSPCLPLDCFGCSAMTPVPSRIASRPASHRNGVARFTRQNRRVSACAQTRLQREPTGRLTGPDRQPPRTPSSSWWPRNAAAPASTRPCEWVCGVRWSDNIPINCRGKGHSPNIAGFAAARGPMATLRGTRSLERRL